MILFTQSTANLHKYLNDELKILCLLQFFPAVAQNSPSFPSSEKSLSIPGFPGLWPLWLFQVLCPNELVGYTLEQPDVLLVTKQSSSKSWQ